MNPSSGRRLACATVAAASLVAAAACSSDRDALTAPPFAESSVPATGGPAGSVAPARQIDSVAVIGDSITASSQPVLEAALDTLDLDSVAIDALGGRRMVVDGGTIGSGRGAVDTIVAGDTPDLWVIALGTNDVANYTPDEYAAAITELLDHIPADAPLVWVDTYLADYKTRSAEFNSTLRTILSERGNATVVDWATTAEQDGVLADGIHPSGYGADQFSAMITAAVDQWMA